MRSAWLVLCSIIHHMNSVACGEADDRSNVQWQTVKEAKAKGKWDRRGC